MYETILDHRILSLRETAEWAGISLATLRRLIQRGEGPLVTRLSERCVGVRAVHLAAWLDERTDGA